jgi:hypothetical protein
MVPSVVERFTGMKRTALARKNSSSSGSLKTDATRPVPRSRYVLCVRNEGYPASLEKLKIYRRIADNQSERHGLIRVIDESGEDYLYPGDFFKAIAIPKPIRRILSRAR